MALLTLEDLEIALGTTFDEDEVANAQYIIDATTSYIENQTGLSFSVKTDITKRFSADYYGRVELIPGPVTDVSAVKDWRTQGSTSYAYWDGLDTVYNLYPGEVVDVTFSCGYETAPGDLKFAATEITKSVVDNLPEGALRSKQVGDIAYFFQTAEKTSFNGMGRSVIDSYRDTIQTQTASSYPIYPNTPGFYRGGM